MLYVKSPCGPCCGTPSMPTIGTITCVSRQGNGSLRGWSKYQNFNSGDWNQRKFTSHTCSGILVLRMASIVNAKTYPPTLPPPDCGGAVVETQIEPAGAGAWNVSANTQASFVALRTVDCFGARIASSSNVGPTGGPSGLIGDVTISYPSDTSRNAAYTVLGSGCTTYTSTGCGGSLLYPCFYVSDIGSLTHTIATPDTVAAAQARATISPDALCRTVGGTTIGSTSSASSSQIAITGPRSVVATLPITSLTNGTDYVVTVKINRYTAGGGSYVDFVYDTIEFTAGASTEDIEYDVPVNTDYDYEIDTSYKDIAAA